MHECVQSGPALAAAPACLTPGSRGRPPVGVSVGPPSRRHCRSGGEPLWVEADVSALSPVRLSGSFCFFLALLIQSF